MKMTVLSRGARSGPSSLFLSLLAYFPALVWGAWLLRVDTEVWRVLGVAAVMLAVALLCFYGLLKRPLPSGQEARVFTGLLIVNGTLVRLMLAAHFYGNYDMDCWRIAAERFHAGVDPYSGNDRYNYTPLWFWILGGLSALQSRLPGVSFHGAVCGFLTLVDAGVLLFLMRLSRLYGRPAAVPALYFYFNPVSFLLTGYHGQIENLAMLFLLTGLWLYRTKGARHALWTLAALALSVKQIVFFWFPLAVRAACTGFWQRLGAVAASAGIFGLLLAPYWPKASADILRHVLGYASRPEPYGFAFLAGNPLALAVFGAGLAFIYGSVRRRALEQQMLILSLFLMTFSPGMGVQYFVLPVFLGALAPSRMFAVYSATAALFLTGSLYNLGWKPLSFVPWNAVWLTAAAWFVTECRRKTTVFLLQESESRV